MRQAGDGHHGRRLRGLIVVLWRAGLRIHEALALSKADLDRRRGSVLVRRVEMAREGIPLLVIQRRRGHTNLGNTSIYLQGIDSAEIIDTVHARTRADGPDRRLTANLTRCRLSSKTAVPGD